MGWTASIPTDWVGTPPFTRNPQAGTLPVVKTGLCEQSMAVQLKKSNQTGLITRFRANLVLGCFVLAVVLSTLYAIFDFCHPTAIESDTYVPIRGSNGAEIVIKTD
jgi:hypothetical protein